MDSAAAAAPDPAWDIAPREPEQHFLQGCPEGDADRLFFRARELAEDIRRRHPLILVEQMIVSHSASDRVYRNSSGTVFSTRAGAYSLELMYSAHRGEKSSSFFSSGVTTADLDRPFIEMAELDRELAAVERQLDTTAPEGKFQGVALLTPGCLGSFLYQLLANFAGETALLNGTSLWRDSLGRQVADAGLTVSLDPFCPDIVLGQRYTPEGFRAEGCDLIRGGELCSFMLGLYAANKTGLPRAKNSGFDLVVAPGDRPLEEIVSGIERGILVGRLSGESPAPNGDFSGVAKNSFLIEDGRIGAALSETMINGNMADMLQNIAGISGGRVMDGQSVLPYIAFSGVTVSGK